MQIAALLTEARHALSVGDRAKAKQLASQALRLDNKHIETWLLLADLVEVSEQKRDCFQRILAIDPTNAPAKQALNRLDSPSTPAAAASFELPKSAWFGTKSAEPELTAQVGGLITTSPVATSSPSVIRPLAQAQTPSLVELSNTPIMPTGYVQPIQPGYGQANYAQPNQAYPLPATSYGQVQPQYGQVAYPHVEPSGAAKFLKWLVFAVFGLMVVCVGISVLSDLGKEPPPTPKVSAQDRTTAMLNDLAKLIINPELHNPNTAEKTAQTFISRYFSEPHHDEGKKLVAAFQYELSNYGSNSQDFATNILPLIQDGYVTPITYKVISQTDRKVVLQIESGDIVYVVINGAYTQNPLKGGFDRFTLINDDGIWYIDDAR